MGHGAQQPEVALGRLDGCGGNAVRVLWQLGRRGLLVKGHGGRVDARMSETGFRRITMDTVVDVGPSKVVMSLWSGGRRCRERCAGGAMEWDWVGMSAMSWWQSRYRDEQNGLADQENDLCFREVEW